MAISVFDIFKIGIGPSSSHTMGPMRAAFRFILGLEERQVLETSAAIFVEVYGSLAYTGMGHGTDRAIIFGLEGDEAETIDLDSVEERLSRQSEEKVIHIKGGRSLPFERRKHIKFCRGKTLPFHSNGMIFRALDGQGNVLHQQTYYSIGGGFVVNEETAKKDVLKKDSSVVKYPITTGDGLLALCLREDLSFAQVMLANEQTWKSQEEIQLGLSKIWDAMQACIQRGLKLEGVLPGPLKVARRAPQIYRNLENLAERAVSDPLTILDWVNLYALSVNEENASGSRVVTAPTNGAAGIIPAVMRYYQRFVHQGQKGDNSWAPEFLLTAGAVGILFTENGSISGAEVGCQGEVGVACSMAAAGLTAVKGGTVKQVEQAAEIGMEHNLGLTCDPVGGLVQIPCIERNAMGAVKAINASRIAMQGDGTHRVSLDSVIQTMMQTGADMKTKYKETSRGGLAVNVTEC